MVKGASDISILCDSSPTALQLQGFNTHLYTSGQYALTFTGVTGEGEGGLDVQVGQNCASLLTRSIGLDAWPH